MYLKRINLNNFRQFYGKQEITFSVDNNKNVTLIHAENGVGKTALLNALLWCFYEKTTARFEEPKKIVSNQAKEEDNFETFVEVLFEHDGNEYLVSRKINEKFPKKDFKAFSICNGNYTPLPNPVTFVESVVPKEMSPYFFFDGEYAETFASTENKKDVREAVEKMLGCNIATQAVSDLKTIKKGLEKEIGSIRKNDDLNAFQKELERLKDEDEQEEAEIDLLENNLEYAETAHKEISEELRGAEGAKEIQKKREDLEKQKNKAKAQKKDIEARRISWIDEFSTGLLSNKLHTACADIIKEANVEGKLPTKIAEKFVNEILQKKVSICGRPFEAGSKEEAKIKSLLVEASTADMNDRNLRISERMGRLAKSGELAPKEFQEINTQLETIASEIDGYEAQIEECGTKLAGSEISEIAEREQAYKDKQKEIIELHKKIALLKKNCKEREGIISDKTKKEINL